MDVIHKENAKNEVNKGKRVSFDKNVKIITSKNEVILLKSPEEVSVKCVNSMDAIHKVYILH